MKVHKVYKVNFQLTIFNLGSLLRKLLYQVLIDRDFFLDLSFEGKILDDKAAGGGAEFLLESSIILKKNNFGAQGSEGRFSEKTVFFIGNYFTGAGHISGNTGETAGHRFQEGLRHTFVERGKYKNGVAID